MKLWSGRVGWLSAGLVASGALVMLALFLDASDLLRRWDGVVYDAAIGLDARIPPEDVVIVAIDQRSLTALGRWPWPRRLHADLVDILSAGGARAIGFDILFAEEDPHDPDGDRRFVRVVAANDRVVLPVAVERAEAAGHLVELLPFPELASAAASLGHVDLELAADGQARQVFLRAGIQSPHWPHMALALAQLAEPQSNWIERLRLVRRWVPGEGNRLAWHRAHVAGIPYLGPPGRFLRVSFVDVLNGTVPAATFAERIVLVGATATGLGEALPTPVSGHAEPMPGVEIIANVLQGIRSSRLIYPLSEPVQLTVTAIVVLALGLMVGWFAGNGRRILALLLIPVPLVAALLLLLVARRWFEPMSAFISLALCYPLWQWRDLRKLARALTTERNRAAKTLQMLAEAVLTVDSQGKVRFLNPAAETLTGWSASKALDQCCDEVFHAVEEDGSMRFSYATHSLDIDALPTYWVLTRLDGSQQIVRALFARLDEPTGERGLVITFSDVTNERKLAEQVRYQASHDSLTGLPNRTLLQDRLLQAIARARRSRRTIAVLYMDVDDFKKINDSLGHVSGDQSLREIGRRLIENVRAEDTVARVGGDEFVILIEHLEDASKALKIAEKLVDQIRKPLKISGHEVFLTTSIGVCFFPQNGTTLAELLRNADSAMYRAKVDGGDRMVVFKSEMNEQAIDRFRLENDLQRALTRPEFRLIYQPIVDLASGRMVGVEALIRWQHPERGLLNPGDFISMAERNGLIVPLGEWVIGTACTDLARWQINYTDEMRLALNLSPRQLKDPRLPEIVNGALQDSGVHPDTLELEITEEIFMADAGVAVATLDRLAQMGIPIAIDDFGTGYSSFGYLKRLPVSRLKIDQSFIRDIGVSGGGAAIVQAIIAMAINLRLEITAEGVETADQVEFCRTYGCVEAQGFYFGKPVSADEIDALLRNTDLPLEASPIS